MPARWMALLPVCLCVAPSDLLLDRPRPPFTALHWLKGIRRNEAKPFLGENVATHRFRRRRRRPTTAMLAKEKMEENKKIHSAVAEEERSGGEGSERSTSKKELLLRPWQRISSSGGSEEGTPSVHPSAHRTTKMIGRSRIQGKARRGPARVQDV